MRGGDGQEDFNPRYDLMRAIQNRDILREQVELVEQEIDRARAERRAYQRSVLRAATALEQSFETRRIGRVAIKAAEYIEVQGDTFRAMHLTPR